MLLFFLDCLKYFVVSKDKNGFGEKGHAQKSRDHRNEGCEGSHINKSESYEFKAKQNNITEFLSIYFV